MWLIDLEGTLGNWRNAVWVRASHPKHFDRFYVVSTSIMDAFGVDETMVFAATRTDLGVRVDSMREVVTAKPHSNETAVAMLQKHLEDTTYD